MHTLVKDLNLLRIFSALWLDRNVSVASRKLGMSQPALSHALARLRVEMRDDVFVRSGRGMCPTPRAEAWAPKVLAALSQLEIALSETEEFSPANAKGRITIVGTDLIEFLLFPKLLSKLMLESKKLILVSRPTDGSFPKLDMERGAIDFAIAGFFADIPEGFYTKQVGVERYASIVRSGHPLVDGKLDLQTYQKLSHVLTSPHGDLAGVVDEVLATKKLKRHVVAGVTTFQVMGKLVAETDCCATLPRSVALEQARLYGLNLFDPPVELPPIKLNLIWHQRIHTSPLHLWMRQVIESILKEV